MSALIYCKCHHHCNFIALTLNWSNLNANPDDPEVKLVSSRTNDVAGSNVGPGVGGAVGIGCVGNGVDNGVGLGVGGGGVGLGVGAKPQFWMSHSEESKKKSTVATSSLFSDLVNLTFKLVLVLG